MTVTVTGTVNVPTRADAEEAAELIADALYANADVHAPMVEVEVEER